MPFNLNSTILQFFMKQRTQPAKEPIAPALKKLHTKSINTKEAVAKSLADYEQVAIAYQNTLQSASTKIALLEGLAAMRIARFAYKIKQTEHKLAKAALKIAKKELHKAEHKAGKAAAEPTVRATKKAAKATKKGAPAIG